jgi:hypothetical protein
MMNQDVYEYCRTNDQCQKIGNMLKRATYTFFGPKIWPVIALLEKPFKKWGLNFIRIIKLTSKLSNSRFI